MTCCVAYSLPFLSRSPVCGIFSGFAFQTIRLRLGGGAWRAKLLMSRLKNASIKASDEYSVILNILMILWMVEGNYENVESIFSRKTRL